jgi:hypothetical protein
MKLLKNKFLIIVVALVVVSGAVGLIIASQFHINTDQSFAQEGYVLGEPVETDEGGYTSPQIHFASGTNYKTNYDASLTFKASDKKKEKLSNFGFAHYQDSSTLSLKNGVLMDPSTIADDSNVICYNVDSGSIMQKNGAAYAIDHLGSQLPLDSLVWKVGEDQYLFAGDSVQLTLGQGNTEDLGSYAEVRYVDSGVIEIKTEEGATFVTVAPACTLTLNGEVEVSMVNLSDGTIQNGDGIFALNQLTVDNPDNFNIASGVTDSQGVILPEFVAEDGKNGENGVSGDSGEEGNPGAAGQPGTEGSEGVEGASGASGVAGPGGSGSEEEEDDGSGEVEVKPSIPDFTLPKLSVAASDDFTITAADGLSARVTISDTDAKDYIDGGVTNVVGTIVDVKTGKVVWQETLNGGQPIMADGTIQFDVDTATYKFDPTREYKLTIAGDYVYKGQTYSKELLKRVFTGGDIGVDFVITDVTSDTIKVSVSKETFSDVTDVWVVLFGPDSTGAEVEITRKPLNALAQLPGTNTIEFGGTASDDSYHTDGVGGWLPGLRQNTTYRVEIQQLSNSASTVISTKLDKTLTAKTLLSMDGTNIHVYAPGYATNRYDRTASVWPGKLQGLDVNSIKKYTYQFFDTTQFDVVTGDLLADEKPVLELTSDGRTSQIANVAYSGAPTDGTTGLNYLQWNKTYKARLVVEYYDNSKTWEFDGDFSDAFGITGALFPVLSFEPDSSAMPNSVTNLYDAIKGTLKINANGVTFKSQNNDGNTPRITIQYRSTAKIGFVKTVTYDLPIGAGNTEFTIPIFVEGLMEDSGYTMAVYGYIDFNDGNGASITNIGTVAVPGAGISIGSLAAETAAPNGFNCVIADLNDPANAASFGVTGLAGSFNALFALTDMYATQDSKYEAERLATMEFELYAGSTIDGLKLGTAQLTSANSIPGNSTLGTGSSTSHYAVSDRIYNGATQGYTYYHVLTEADFGIASGTVQQYPTVTLLAKRATDYTTHNTWTLGPSYFNEFPLGGTKQLTLVVHSIAPPLPEVNNAFYYTLIEEGNRTRYFESASAPFNSADPRPGYLGDTKIGFQLQARFGAPSIARSFTYNIYRSKIESQTESVSTGELENANRELAFTTGPINVIVDTTSQYAFVIPKIIVLFGSKTDYNLVDNPDDATYYYYLSDTYDANGVWQAVGGGITMHNSDGVATIANESNGRGYTYYATYTANLTLEDGHGGGANSFIYPRDYNGDSLDHTNTILYSRRLATPLQKPIIKTYPSTSGGTGTGQEGQEIWKYRMLDVDGAFVANSLNTPTIGPGSVPATVTPSSLNNKLGNLASPLYSDQFAVEGLDEGAFSVRYKYNIWRYTLEAPNIVNHVPPEYTQLLQFYHEFPYNATTKIDSVNQKYELYVNKARGNLYVIFRNMSVNDQIYRRLAIAKITVQNNASVTGKTKAIYYVPVSSAIAFDEDDPALSGLPGLNDQYLSAAIDLQKLTADLKGADTTPTNSTLIVSVDLIYDDGHRGFDVVANLNTPSSSLPADNRWAIQELSPLGAQSMIYGDYFSRNAALATPMKLIASSIYYSDMTFAQPVNETDFATLDYIVPLEFRDVHLKFTLVENGAKESVSGYNVAPKSLSLINFGPSSAADNNFVLPPLLPVVYEFFAIPGLEEATVDFRIEGQSVINGYVSDNSASNTSKLILKLYRGDLAAGAGSSNTLIGTFNNIVVEKDIQDYKFYFGSGTPPAGYTQLALSYENPAGTLRTGLEMNKLYYFTLEAVIGSDPSPSSLFDDDWRSTNRPYQFRTSDNVKIGGPTGTELSFTFDALAYNNKYITAHYPLTGPARGYYIEYIFTNVSQSPQPFSPTNPLNVTQTVLDTRSVYSVAGTINDYNIPYPKLPPGDPFFNFGESYKVELVAKTDSTNAEIGRSAVVDYTIPSPITPQFIVTATPGSSLDGNPDGGTYDPVSNPQNYPTVFHINPLDPSCSIAGPAADGQYIVRVLNSSNQDVTASVTHGSVTIGGVSSTFSTSLLDQVFTFNKGSSNRIQNLTISGQDLPTGSGYTLNIYAVVDAPYDGVSSPNLIEDKKTGSASVLAPYLIRSTEFDIHNENEVTIGDITVSSQSTSSTRLIFENQINLSPPKVTKIQYSITDLGASGMAVASAPIDFSFAPPFGGTSPYNYFDIPDGITTPGLYQIELRFTGPGVNVSKTINYRKI